MIRKYLQGSDLRRPANGVILAQKCYQHRDGSGGRSGWPGLDGEIAAGSWLALARQCKAARNCYQTSISREEHFPGRVARVGFLIGYCWNATMTLKKSVGLILAACCLLLLCGCEGSDGKRAVSGTVTLQGQPLDTGTITFLKLPEAQTPAGAALITQGKYDLPATQGLLPGNYRVKVNAIPEYHITPEEYAAGKTAPARVDRIPAKYNTASEETVEVKESGANKFDIMIE